MKKFFFILILGIQMQAQKRELIVLDKSDYKTIENALFYSNTNKIGQSNKEGIVKLKSKGFDKITIVKEDYYDTIINLENLKSNKLYLKKIEATNLDGIIITKTNIKTILENVKLNILKSQNINNLKYQHFFNVLTFNTDTLIYVNNRINYIKSKGAYIDNKNNVIANFTVDNKLKPIFNYNKIDIALSKNFNHNNSPLNNFELMLVLDYNSKKFNFEVSEQIENRYYIVFKPSNTNNEFLYSGFLIVDKNDFGIYEFSAVLSKKEIKHKSLLNDKLFKYITLNLQIFLKCEKDVDNKYYFVKYDYDTELKFLSGELKDVVFLNKCRKEITPEFDISASVPFDVSTYKIDHEKKK